MTIPFTCPHCQTQTDVYEEFAGQTGPCAICGKPVTVPYPSTAMVTSRTDGGAATAEPATITTAPAEPTPTRSRRGSSIIVMMAIGFSALGAAGLVVIVLFAFIFPAVNAARVNALKSDSATKMGKIHTALINYESMHGSFPPAYIADDKGRPMHSWRVLILPQLGYQHVYDQYNFSEPWDGPRNSMLVGMMPTEYASNADADAMAQQETSFMVISGQNTMFPGAGAVKREDMLDRYEDTIVLAETPTCGVCWMQPRDFELDPMLFEINGREGVEIGSRHPNGAHVITADGQVHFLYDSTPADMLRGMATINGGEMIYWEVLE